MTKEHAYAYEAGYRDGSIHYELEHCPACKNVADLQEALEENAKLREQLEYALQTSRARLETIDRLKAENAKLRELVLDLYDAIDSVFWDGEVETRERFEPRMSELGIEVDV